MRKFLSIIIVLSMLLNCIPALAVADADKPIISILTDSSENKVKITSDSVVSDTKLYVVAFNEEAMIGAVSKPVDLKIGENIIDMEPTWSVGERDVVKIFLWDENMEPLADMVIAKTPMITVETLYADATDGTVKVEVSVLNNPGVSSLKFDVAYDDYLTLTGVELSEDFGAYLTAAEPFTNPQPISMISPLEDIYTSGVIATLTFDMSNVPENMEYADISIICDDENIFDSEFNYVDFSAVNGKIIFDETLTLAECADEDIELMSAENLTLTVDEVSGMPGETVEVNLTLSNNPGIASLMFNVEYSELLTLEAVKFNSDFGAYATAAQPFTSPQPISFISPFSDVTIDDTFATLTFRISDTAEDKSVANINITYSEDDVFNSLYEYVDLTVVNGKVTVYEGIPGDINADGKVNNMDAILLFRYVAKWNVEVDEEALDVTGDSKIGNIDAIQLFRYVAKWPGIILVRGSVCVHELEEVPEKEATCTEDGNIAYWHCSKCDKYYSDAKASKMIALSETITEATGHTEVVLPAVAPTYTETGLTEGRKCSVCEKILMPQEKVPALDLEEYYISYSFTDGDPYLQSLVAKGVLVNENPTTYTKQDTIKLKNLSVDGYIFEGWFDGPWEDASRITTISNQSGSLTLYAKWSKITYTVTFDSPDVPVESVSYTVDTEVTLTNPSWFGYTFVGWSKDGKIVSSIPKGTTGNITLHANWTSNRNRATAVNSLDSPIVIEDWNNGRYLFVYEIGTIENVPLGVIEYIGNSQGITINKEYTYTQTVSESFADTIAQTVSNATTKTSSWTLSEEWNKSASATNEHEEVEGKTASQTDSEGNVTEGKYYVSNSEGGVTSTTSSAGGSSGTSSKVTEGSSTGINGSYTRGAEKAGSVSVDISHTKSHTDTSNSNWNASGTVGYTPPEKTGGIGGSGTIGGGHEWGDEDTTEDSTSVGVEVSAKDSESATIAGERAENFGTENTSSSESHWDISNTSTSSWNSTAGYEVGQSTSMNTEISNTISEAIYDRYSYTSVASRGGGTASTQSTGESQSLSNEYASTVEYLSEDQATISKSIVYNSDATGYYRLVTAGTLHVFAVVGYDIATNSYYTYTYNVLDEERHEYLDYSKDNANFNDCENAIIPFEVPYYVNEFITSVIARSEGLVVDMETGFITEYNGEATDVVIPQYISVDNGDGTYSAVRIRGFEEDAFKGNTKITGVVLPKYVSEIPDNAFAGCTSLKTVIAYGVSEIGDNAFAGCTSLDKFSVDEHISSLGEKAFKDVPEISVVAENENIFNATINSGAKRITLNLTAMDTTLTDKTILINESTDYFALVGNGSEYSNVQLESHATETFISNMNFVNNTGTALKFSSAMVTLSRVTVENATEFALVLMAENTALNLYGTIVLSSSGDNAVISKNVTLAKANSEVAGKLDFSGKYLVCGDVTNISMLKYPENVKEITAEEYAKYMTTVTVSFDTDGGTDIISVTTGYDTKITAPQNPEKDHYSFLGWYTDEACTTEFSFNTSITNDMTLYAKWKLNEFKISFDANGGTADVSEKSVIYGTTV